jgi:hypothetical protein
LLHRHQTELGNEGWHTYENLLLRLPKKNKTMPVTMHAEVKRTLLSRPGKDAGIITYPSKGMAPNSAKEQNMTQPEDIKQRTRKIRRN